MNKLQLTSDIFLDRHNDCLQIEITRGGCGQITLSDCGYIITDLEICGFDRVEITNFIMKKFKNFKIAGDEIILETNEKELKKDIKEYANLFFKALSDISCYWH